MQQVRPAGPPLWTLACLFAAPSPAADTVHRYVVSGDANLERLRIEARFAGPVNRVSARSRDADDFLRDARQCDDDQPVRNRGRRFLLPADGIECLRYAVDLGRAAEEHRYNSVLDRSNIIVSPALWMWRPAVRAGTSIHVEFRLPEGVGVSVPWRPLDPDGRNFELTGSPESAYAPAVFGDLDYRELPVPGATLRVTMLRGKDDVDGEAITRWLRATATDVSLAYGRFPNPSPQVVVIPVGSSRRNARSAVPFGRVIRDGGETVELLVDQTQPLARLLVDWTATHEFSHLMLPYVDRRHRWISEGFAQYYQNVLLARSGAYLARDAWQKIYEGYGRGTRARPDLSPNQAAAERARSGLMKMYWSGAALALLADVELRERTAGRLSLDVVLDRFQACCLPSDRVWQGEELFARFDELAGMPVFVPLFRQHADTAGFPDTSGVFERLGLAISDGRVHLRDDAELAAVREAILATDADTASWRQDLTAY